MQYLIVVFFWLELVCQLGEVIVVCCEHRGYVLLFQGDVEVALVFYFFLSGFAEIHTYVYGVEKDIFGALRGVLIVN